MFLVLVEVGVLVFVWVVLFLWDIGLKWYVCVYFGFMLGVFSWFGLL